MKLYKSLAAACLMSGLLASCGENAWNDHLDGFDGNPEITDVNSVEYTLTEANYATIAGLSDNLALAGDDKAALEAVGERMAFSPEAPASKYIPAFLSCDKFPYYLLNDGSSVKVTYNQTTDLPDEIKGISEAKEYIVSDEDYQNVWGSADNYTPSFAPSHTPATSIPGLLRKAFPDAAEGDYVVVNYNYSNIDPTFGGGGGQNPPEEFTLSEVISTVEVGGTYDINGIITGVSTNGFILTDKSGSIFCFMNADMDASTYSIGTQLVCEAVISSYNKGLQIAGANSVFEVKGKGSYTYPAPKVYTAADIEAIAKRTENEPAYYGQISGTVKVSGNNINIDMGAENAMGGVYYATDDIKAKLVDGENVTVTGYLIAIAASRYVNFVATDVQPASKSVRRKVVAVPSTNMNGVYVFNGTNWSSPSGMVALNPDDYRKMGFSRDFLSAPADYLPTYLRINYPYAKDGFSVFVVYNYGTSADKAKLTCDQYFYNNGEWTPNNGVEVVTEQFVRTGGKWIYDPNVTINLPAGKNQPMSMLYYQACVDWVYENIDVPLGSTSITSGVGYVTKYGNNDYYCGASAYQGNVDLRASSARGQYAAGYEGMTDEEVVATMKDRFCKEVFPQALAKLNPDARPIPGIEVLYTINFSAYTGVTTPYVLVYRVVDTAKFEFVSCTWYDEEK